MKKKIILASLVAVTIFSACKKDTPAPVKKPTDFDVSVNGKIVTVKNLPADTIIGTDGIGRPIGAGKYTFFSLETNSLIPNSDSATAKWDLAFAGSTIRVNNLTSGPGKGGAFIYTGTFESLLSVPTNQDFLVDNHPTSYAIPKGSWYTYEGATNLFIPIPGRVVVIRTANEKYAKVEILNYYRGGVTPSATATNEEKAKNQRFYTFRYTYQPDGSTTF
jgi:hypothetical protein